jgi:hypothetical protein
LEDLGQQEDYHQLDQHQGLVELHLGVQENLTNNLREDQNHLEHQEYQTEDQV